MKLFTVVLLVACSSPAEPPSARPPARSDDTQTADARADGTARWLAGDLHMHVAPPDRDDVTASISEIAANAVHAGMDFLVLTPHIWDSEWRAHRAEHQHAWRDFATAARRIAELTVIPGIEWTTRQGHFTVAGTDIAALDAPDLLAAARAAGAFISVNHPFAVPTRIPSVRISDFDMSYRVWSERAPGFTAIDGAEVWNVPLALANLISRPGGATGEQRAWLELDRVVHAEHRRVTAVGGTDDHHGHAMATTWVLAEDASEAAILAALHRGATCVGGPEAGSFRARGDGAWVAIGGSVSAATITLAWLGSARLFVDGRDLGEHDGGFVHATGGALHTYRIEHGRSRSGFIYANLPAP